MAKKSQKVTLYAFAMCTMIKDTFKDLSADNKEFIKNEGSNFYSNTKMFPTLDEAITEFSRLSNCEDGNQIEIQPLRKKEAVIIVQQGEVKNSAIFIKIINKGDKTTSTYVTIDEIIDTVKAKQTTDEKIA